MNKVLLAGVVGKVYSNPTVVTLSIATKEVTMKDNSWVEETEWHTVKVFGKSTAQAGKYEKGDEVEVVGRIKSSKYTNKDGKEIVNKEIIADSVKRVRKAKSSVTHPIVDEQQAPQQTEQTEGDLPF